METVYELIDPDGRVIGQVVRPVSPELVGRAVGTILLRRPAPGPGLSS